MTSEAHHPSVVAALEVLGNFDWEFEVDLNDEKLQARLGKVRRKLSTTPRK